MTKLSPEGKERLKEKKKLFFYPIKVGLKDVSKVVAHIHRIEITTSLLARDISLSTGKIKTRPIIEKEQPKKHYRQEGNFNYYGFKVHILSSPFRTIRGFQKRKSLLTIVPKGHIDPRRHRNLLERLQNELVEGDVIVRSVELAYDFVTKDTYSVSYLFENFQKVFYLKNITIPENIFFDGGQQYRTKKLNRVIKFKIKRTKQKKHKWYVRYKLYERGDDSDRKNLSVTSDGKKIKVKGWTPDTLDRVRFERTIFRYELQKKKIKNLSDLTAYTNEEGTNLLCEIQGVPEIMAINTGAHKYNYNFLMAAVVQMKRKSGYLAPINFTIANLLRGKMKRSIIKHSEKWSFDPSDIRAFLRRKSGH